MPKARPRPIFGFVDQSASYWVTVDVFQLLGVFWRCEHVEVIVAGLPEWPFFAFHRNRELESLNCFRQDGILRLRYEKVDVFGHYDVAEFMATLTSLQPGILGGGRHGFRARYGNYIGGEWVDAASGQYFENMTPVTGKAFCEIPRSNAQDVEKALDAAHAAKARGARPVRAERANILNKIAQRMEDNLELLAEAETWDNGKPIRETMAADLPLAIDHFRYFAGAIRAQEGGISRSTMTRWRTTFMSRWGWWGRSFRGTFRS
jgi:hypothetical protein